MLRFIWKLETSVSLLVLAAVTVGLGRRWLSFPFPDWIEFTLLLLEIILLLILGVFSRSLQKVKPVLFWALVFLVFISTRWWWLANVPTLPVSDFQYYLQVAREVAVGKGLTNEVVLYQNGWGYQLFLGSIFALLGDSLGLAKIVNLLLGIITIPWVYLVGENVGGLGVGRWATLLFVFWPVQWMYTSVLATEHLALPLVLAGFWFGLRLLDQRGDKWANAIISALLMTLSTFVRPTAVIYLGAIILVVLFAGNFKKNYGHAAILIAVFLISNGIYNYSLKVFNHGIVPSFSFSTAANIFYGSALESNGGWSPEDFKIVSSWTKENALQNALPLTWQRVSSYSPGQVLNLFKAKGIEFWGSPYFGLFWSTVELDTEQSHIELPINILNGVQYIFQFFIFSGSIVSLIFLYQQSYNNKLSGILIVFIVGTILHLVFVVSARYSYIYTPLLFLLCGYGMNEIGNTKRLNLNNKEKTMDGSIAKSLQEYNSRRIQLWDDIASQSGRWTSANRFYHKRLLDIYQYLVSPGMRILELGCANGDLLASLKPSYGVGVDFSKEMITKARQRHPDMHFYEGDVHQLNLNEQFDVIILSDLINDLWDVESVFRQLTACCTPRTRVILNYYSRVWSPLFAITERLGLSRPRLPQNWFVTEDVENLLYLANFEVLRTQQEILWPLPIKFFDALFNRFLVKIWPFQLFALTNFTIARPAPGMVKNEDQPLVSVIVPARNEAGNISEIMARVPELGGGTEIVFVEGHSTDNTFETIQQAITSTTRCCKLFRQNGKGKADAVRLGFSEAAGSVLMILDADLTVPPETLPSFYDALISGKGEFVNGVRLVYPMDKEAMQFFNLVGNKFFSVVFSWLIGQSIKDTLCGTKVLWKADYELIAANRSYFGDFDPFGDYDLIFGAAKLQLKITDLPIRYRERVYGTTNIQRWKHGLILLKMVAFSARRIKFI